MRSGKWSREEGCLAQRGSPEKLGREELTRAKRLGLSDASIARAMASTEGKVRARRHALGVRPVFKTVDTCAAEFEAETPYFYSTYEQENESLRTERPKVAILGGGPNRIGQGIEFDYCCVHACYALSRAGFETVMINCNPETVSTDYDTSDRLYFEPLTFEDVSAVLDNERPDGVLVQFGGQTPLKLARSLEAAGVPDLGNVARVDRSRGGPRPVRPPARGAGSPGAPARRGAVGAGGPRGREADRLPAHGAALLRARRPRDGRRLRRRAPGHIHGTGAGELARPSRPHRSVPGRRVRVRRGRPLRRHGDVDRGDPGAHRGGGHSLGGLLLRPAGLQDHPGAPDRDARARRGCWPGPCPSKGSSTSSSRRRVRRSTFSKSIRGRPGPFPSFPRRSAFRWRISPRCWPRAARWPS